MNWPDLLNRPRPAPTRRIAVGPGANNFAELWLPTGAARHPLVLMLHGGCWQKRIADLSIMNYIAEDLRRHGIAVWNIEYRGVDEAGGGYPGTFLDVARAADALRDIAKREQLDLDRVIAVGHSAGGHLAAWLAARPRIPKTSPLYRADPLPISAVVIQGGLPDLEAARDADGAACGPEVIEALVGRRVRGQHASRQSESARDELSDTSPARLLPLGVPQVLVTGADDGIAPPWLAQRYYDKAVHRGDAIRLVVIPEAGHVELIAPGTTAWARTLAIIQQLLQPPTPRRNASRSQQRH